MPCYVTGSEIGDLQLFAKEDREAAKVAHKEVLKLTQMLCIACRYLELHRDIPPEVVKWWKKHKKLDAKSRKCG